jgi:hypothetical protein
MTAVVPNQGVIEYDLKPRNDPNGEEKDEQTEG